MSSIRDELIALDTNQYVFAVRRDPHHLHCRTLLFQRTKGLRVFVPGEVVRELHRNLIPSELQAALSPLRKASEVVWGFRAPPDDIIDRYLALGAKKGDAVIAAHLEASEVYVLVTENRHFLHEIPDLPFRVTSAADILPELG